MHSLEMHSNKQKKKQGSTLETPELVSPPESSMMLAPNIPTKRVLVRVVVWITGQL